MIKLLKERMILDGINNSQMARNVGKRRQYIDRVLSGETSPSWRLLIEMWWSLGYSLVPTRVDAPVVDELALFREKRIYVYNKSDNQKKAKQ